MGDQLTLKGVLEGHSGWVTAITTYQGVSSGDQRVNRVLSASRDKTIIVWEITEEEGNFGYAVRALKGHNHFVSDVALARSGDHALSCSWDGTLRLWNIDNGKCITQFKGHTKDVLPWPSAPTTDRSCLARDHTVAWNILGDCKYTIQENGLRWVSCVRLTPIPRPLLCLRLGQARKGLVFPQGHRAAHQPGGTYWLLEHRDRSPRWISVCLWWQGRHCDALGPH